MRDAGVAIDIVPVDGHAPPARIREGQVRPSFTPDGKALWSGSGETAERVDLATGDTQRELRAPPGTFLTQLLELADGRVFARVWDRSTRKATGLLRYDPDDPSPHVVFDGEVQESLALAPDGASVLVSKILPTGHVELWQIPVGGSAPSSAAEGLLQATKGLAFSPTHDRVVWSTCDDANRLSVLDGDRTLQMTPLFPDAEWSDGEPAPVPGDDEHLVVVSAVSLDGRTSAFGAKGLGLYVVSFDGSSPPRRLTTEGPDDQPTFARDGATVYFTRYGADSHPAIEAVPADGSHEPTLVVDGADSPSASRVEDRLAYAASPGELRTLDLRSGRSKAVPGVSAAHYRTILWSPDGRRFLVVDGMLSLVEIDASTGAKLRTYVSGDQIHNAVYLGKRIVISRGVWRGDLWMADL
jgi:hypothetical protein